MRSIAAEARRLLLEMASSSSALKRALLQRTTELLALPQIPSKTVSYAELVGGRYFNTKVEWNKKTAATLRVKGKAKPKVPSEYKIVGKSMPRTDIAPKVFGKFEYVSDVRLPGMLHGRMIRPSVAGAVPTAVDENSIKEIKGARAVWIKDFLGVVADKEWDAVRAAKALKVTWSDVKPPFPKQAELHDHIRAAQVTKREIEVENGSVETAFADAAKQGLRVVEAEYEWPFQSHASMGPAVSVVDVTPQHVTIYTGTQKPYAARDGIAKLLGRDRKDVTPFGWPVPAPMAATTLATPRRMLLCFPTRSASRYACNIRAPKDWPGIRKDRHRSTGCVRPSILPARSSRTTS